MSKAVLISIRPKWCQLIALGEKTIEIRKTRPKLETPFKCYIYCTLSGSKEFFNETLKGDVVAWNKGEWAERKGTVIGEFTCNNILEIGRRGFNNNFDYCYESLNIFGNDDIESYITAVRKSCLSKNELNEYGKNSHFLYAWSISDLVIYEKASNKPLFRPPQSWCYVKEMEG